MKQTLKTEFEAKESNNKPPRLLLIDIYAGQSKVGNKYADHQYIIKLTNLLGTHPELTRKNAHRMLDKALDGIINEIKIANGVKL